MRHEAHRLNQLKRAEKAARFKHIERLNHTIAEACYRANVGRSSLYAAIAAGELETLKLGKRRLVPDDALRRWLATKRVV